MSGFAGRRRDISWTSLVGESLVSLVTDRELGVVLRYLSQYACTEVEMWGPLRGVLMSHVAFKKA